MSWGHDNNLVIHAVIQILRKKVRLHLSLKIIQIFLKRLAPPPHSFQIFSDVKCFFFVFYIFFLLKVEENNTNDTFAGDDDAHKVILRTRS